MAVTAGEPLVRRLRAEVARQGLPGRVTAVAGDGEGGEVDRQLVHLLRVEELANAPEADVLARATVALELGEHERLELRVAVDVVGLEHQRARKLGAAQLSRCGVAQSAHAWSSHLRSGMDQTSKSRPSL